MEKKGQFHNGSERKAVKLPGKIREQSEMVWMQDCRVS